MPSVVNIFTSKEVKVPRHPFMDDPLFRRFFGDQLDGDTQHSSSLGSGPTITPDPRLELCCVSPSRQRAKLNLRLPTVARPRQRSWEPIQKPIWRSLKW